MHTALGTLLATASAAGLLRPVAAQTEAAVGQDASRHRNLQVLPKTIPDAELKSIMRLYVRETGIPCEGCHVTSDATQKLDYASEENPMKGTARDMMRMTNAIQNNYLSKLGDRRYSPKFSCATCHRGLPEPAEFISGK